MAVLNIRNGLYMLKPLRLIIATLISGALFTFVVAGVSAQVTETPQPEATQPPNSIADNVCKGVLSAEQGSYTQNTSIASCQETDDNSFSFLVRRIIDIFSIVVGAVSVIMIIIGGFRYIISGGDSSGIQGAKNTILYAIVGLVIVLFAQVIIRFVLTNAAPNAIN